MISRLLSWFLLLGFFLTLSDAAANQSQYMCESSKYESKPRVFVSTDIGNEPDDQMSLVRFLTYANEFDIQGLVATTSVWLNSTTNEATIRTILDSYDEVIDNLNANVPPEGQYPSGDSLRNVTSSSKPVYGIASFDGALSSGAQLLIDAVDLSEKPLWFVCWGGTTVLAESLNQIRKTRQPEVVAKFVEKLRVYAISDQDNSGPWIRTNFPSLFYIVSIHQFSLYFTATWPGISGEAWYSFDEGGPDTSLVTNEWLQLNVRKGPLGQHYLNYSYIMEGDTPSFLHLIQNGLGEPEHPEWGGWGGRYGLIDATNQVATYSHSVDHVQGVNGESFLSNQATIWRWRKAYQYDFASRMDWSVASDSKTVNHAPIVVVNNTCGPESLQYTIKTGESVTLDASQSWDPDGDALTYDWFFYKDVNAGLQLGRDNGPVVQITPLTPDGSKVVITPLVQILDYHIILTVSDNQERELVAYRRIILYLG